MKLAFKKGLFGARKRASLVLGMTSGLRRRLLVMLPWLMERGETPLADVARHFDLTPEEVAADLELAAMCGLPPFVDEMIDVFIDDDVVFVGVPRLFTRPLRLTAPEGFALVAAGRVAMQLPGADPEGPLGRGLKKLAAALGDEAVVVDLPRPPGLAELIDELTAAVRRIEQVEVRYWTASRDEVTERVITPRRIFSDHGDWYVVADDQRSGDFKPLRFLPKGKTVVLGLVTTKLGELEKKDDLKRRIDEAASYAPLDQLALSPQCGFSSTVHGNKIAVEAQRAKLRLVIETAEEVWGKA